VNLKIGLTDFPSSSFRARLFPILQLRYPLVLTLTYAFTQMKRKLKIGVTILILALLAFIGNTLYTSGLFKTLTPHLEGNVKAMYRSMYGTEDLDIDYKKGLLFISSSDRWKQLKGEPVEGSIFLLQLDSGIAPTKIPTTYQGVFRPHGISFLSLQTGDYLFVVNHNDEGNYVELFEFTRDTLFHQKSYADQTMCCPNDVVGVGVDKFYVTNDHGTKKGTLRKFEDYLRIPLSYLLYYDGAHFTKAYEGLTYGNGVNISNDGSTLYLTHTTGRELLTLDRNKETGKITLLNKLNLSSGLDNVSVDENDDLWIGSHPKMLKFIGHATDSLKKSPSQVFKLSPKADRADYSIEEIYLNDGEEISASSVAIHYKNELFVGGVFENKLLRINLAKK
jgi:arylesterase / paraoxonase